MSITTLNMGKSILKSRYEVYALPSGERLFKFLETVTPDLILLDVEMPDINGYDVIKKIKSISRFASLPVIFLTSKNNEADELRGFDLGAIDYITKPFSAPRLLKRIENQLLLVQQKVTIQRHARDLSQLINEKIKEAFELQNMILATVADMAEFLDDAALDVVIDGLDIVRGLNRFNGDKATYLKVLRSYAFSLIRFLNTDWGDFTDYEIAVHGIKGASRDIFAEAIGQCASNLESAARSGDMAYIRQHQPAFHTAARRLADDILAFIAHINAKKQRPKRDKLDGEMLRTLRQACEAYDMDGADAALTAIEAYEYESDVEFAAWLRERADLADFTSISEILAKQDE